MSSTTGKKNLILDAYYTRAEDAQKMVARLLPYLTSSCTIWDPYVGAGAFVDAFLAAGIDPRRIFASDINPNAPGMGAREGVTYATADALKGWPWPFEEAPDWSPSNPPFSDAQLHAEALIKASQRGVALLLRAGFAASGERAGFWAEHGGAGANGVACGVG